MDDLLDKILMPENIRAAIDEVRKNKGAPGIDKMPVDELMGYFALNESTVIRQILIKEYRPQPVRRVHIPKPNSDKLRPLGIPTVVDRVVQRALSERPGVVRTVTGIIDRIVKDSERREKIRIAMADFERLPAEQLFTDDEDFLLVFKAIHFFPDYHIEAELVDGSRMKM